MKWLSDPTRRFIERPHFAESEIQHRVEVAVANVLDGNIQDFPITDNALDLLVDCLTSHYDPEADLHSRLGDDVEGVTIFRPGEGARVKISSHLLAEENRKRRRMTIAHEVGHVLLHSELYSEERTLDLFSDSEERGRVYCKRATMLPGVDWMEWQASFAGGCILMPSLAIRNAMVTLRGDRADQSLYADDSEADSAVSFVANRFDVSYDAARVRLMQTGFIEQHKSIQRLPLWSEE